MFIFNIHNKLTVISTQGCPASLFLLPPPDGNVMLLQLNAFSGVSLPGGTASPPTSGTQPAFLQLKVQI